MYVQARRVKKNPGRQVRRAYKPFKTPKITEQGRGEKYKFAT